MQCFMPCVSRRHKRNEELLRQKREMNAMKKMLGISARITVTAASAMAFALGLVAQNGAKPQESTVPKTSFDSATDHLDRTMAGPITRPMLIEIAPATYFINEFGMDAQYLVVGQKRALVIDTGSGFYDLKGLVENMTKLPYDVVVTHGHPDHAGAVGQFDTIYMHPADAAMPMFRGLSQKMAKQYGEIMWGMPIGYRNVWGYTPADAKWGGWDKHPDIRPLYDGQVFDLGGRRVTVYHVPGHTPGSCVFIDDKSRILFSGDAANLNVGAESNAVSTSLRGLIRLQKLRTDYDRQYTGHVAYAGTLDAVSQSPQVLDDVVEAFREVLQGKAEVKVVPSHIFPSQKRTVAVHGVAEVGFDPNRLWEPNEEHKIPQ
jgi:hydroxyacylglutathione hydrolase